MHVDPERFLADLKKLRSFGAQSTGVVRRAFSDADTAARDWLLSRFAEAGLDARRDPAGNVWGLAGGKSVLTGSHSDTQPEGGWLDGALGVIAGLEVARAAAEAGGPPVSCVSFQDEEGRFGALTGSDIWTGRLALADADRLTAADGLTFGAARALLQNVGAEVPADRFRAFVELHIEQGPVLDRAGEAIGVVTDIVGAREIAVTLRGEQNHAGTTPMHMRRDAVAGFAAAQAALTSAFEPILDPATVWTIGRVEVWPNASSVVPGSVSFSLQWRDASEERLGEMDRAARRAIEGVAAARGLGAEFRDRWSLAPTAMDPGVVEACAAGAEEASPGRWRRMPSGALHDAANVARIVPTGMLFVPSKGGISHDFAEDTDEGDLVAGLRALARSVAILGG